MKNQIITESKQFKKKHEKINYEYFLPNYRLKY